MSENTATKLDEIWCFVGKKQRRKVRGDDPFKVGDFWTFVAIDADTRFVPSYRVGKRDRHTTDRFVMDLAYRIPGRIQLSSDALESYARSIAIYFSGRVDYGRVVKSYVADPIGPGRYSPPRVKSVSKSAMIGSPDLDHISTSYVERSNLTLRMQSRRFTRLTNAFSKKVENLRAAVALHFAHYNYCRTHRSLGATPAQAIGLDPRPWTLRDLVDLAETTSA